MLQSFSDRIRNSRWLGYLIVGLISIPFALWGIQSYIGGPATDTAAEVNGEPIPAYQVQRMASQQRQQLRERFGGELPAGLGDGLFLERALNQLIQRELLRQEATEAGFRVTDATLRSRIREQEMFRQDGEFDRELYRRILSQAQLTPQRYEADVRVGYRIEQLRRGITETAFALDNEAWQTARLMRQERNVALLVHPRAPAAAAVELDEQQLREYYEANREQFRTPAQVRASFVELDLEALREQVEVEEEELRAEYRRSTDLAREQQERKAAHILLEVEADAGQEAEAEARERARELKARLEQGAEFAELAREYSQDPGSAQQGGDLGYVSRGSMVEAFERALFGLEEEGAVSEPVRTPYGVHLIKLLDIRGGAAEKPPFEAVRDELERELRTRRAERLFYDRVEVLRNTSYEQPGSLEPAAEATGLEIRTTDWFSRNRGDGIATDPEVRAAAFAPEVREERLNSELIELGPRRLVVLRIDDERPARPQPFEAVRDEVEQRLRAERTNERLQDWAEQVVARLESGTDPAALAEEPVELREPGWVSRQSGELQPGVRDTAFELPTPAAGASEYGIAELDDGDRAVVVVRDARLPEVEPDAVRAAKQQLRQSMTTAEISAYLAALRAEADIERNEDALAP